MKTKFYWVALLASAALIGQAQGGGYLPALSHDGHAASFGVATCG